MNYRQTRRPTGRRTNVVEWWWTRGLQDSTTWRVFQTWILSRCGPLYLRSRYFQTWWKTRGSAGFSLFLCSRKIRKCKRRWTRVDRLLWWNGTLKKIFNTIWERTCIITVLGCLGLIFKQSGIYVIRGSHKTIEELETREHPETLREPRQNVTNTVG